MKYKQRFLIDNLTILVKILILENLPNSSLQIKLIQLK